VYVEVRFTYIRHSNATVMKKTILTISATLFVVAAVVLASFVAKENNCPCTLDCQPGDEWCTCIIGCEK
jgi:hypothetical protein